MPDNSSSDAAELLIGVPLIQYRKQHIRVSRSIYAVTERTNGHSSAFNPAPSGRRLAKIPFAGTTISSGWKKVLALIALDGVTKVGPFFFTK